MINAVFKLVGSNPSTIFLVSGILFLLIGGITINSGYIDSVWFISSAVVMLAVGIAMHLLWLFRSKKF